MRPKCALIYNEKSSGFNEKTFKNILKSIYDNGYIPVPISSEYPDFIVENIEQYNEAFDIIFTMGGDGTVSTAYEAFHRLNGNQKALYGHIPVGTTNDMGPNTYVPRYNAPKAVQLLLNGSVENRDIISINDRAIAYVGSGGILAPATYLIDKSNDKKDVGTLSYVRYGAKKFFSDPELYHNIVKDPYQITVETSEGKMETETIFFSVFNAISFAHLRINPKANLCNGKFDVALVHNQSELLKILGSSLISKNGVMGIGDKTVFSTDYLKITFNDRTPYYPVNCDGDAYDLLGDSNTLEVKPQGKIKQLVGRRK